MRYALLSLFLLPLPGCGGDTQVNFSSAEAAMEAGDAALAARDAEAAVAAFSHAFNHDFVVDCEMAWKARARLCEAELLGGNIEGAKKVLEVVLAPESSATSSGLRRLGDAMVLAGEADLAEQLMVAAVKRFPEEREVFSRIADGLEALKSGDAQALAALGYAGD